MSIDPEPGLVIRYDYLWKEEKDAGQEDGRKDRPCAIILKSEPDEDGSRKVLVCPITHSPPSQGETGVEIPPKVAQHLKLDDDRSWIKTHEMNRFTWEAGGFRSALRLPIKINGALVFSRRKLVCRLSVRCVRNLVNAA